ncbi:Transcriptional activator hacA [Talaromyces islandicus]|uniref:Transcriptional activator hacA n=1 Tax=Talaromyces islandicus TaxID=28573 RepID=A0A0U1LZG0_TALIS|nr:Transcriptional activator hacA [Talaromyces islandicus]
MENLLSPHVESLDAPQLTISPADTSLSSPAPEVDLDVDLEASAEPEVEIKDEEPKSDEKKPVKKRKSWGQELPTPKTNLPPRKRAKTEDEKEQRRIERVLRNRAAAQTSRERKRLEVEKLEGEKKRMEQQNQFLLQRLSQMESENNRLNRQVAQLSAEIRGSRGTTPKSVVSDLESPTLTPTLFKQERDELAMDKIPFPTPSLTDYSPSLKPTDLAEASDLTQHPAAVLCDLQSANDLAAPLSDDDFRRLFSSDSPAASDSELYESGLPLDFLDGGDMPTFAFDSLVDFDPEPVALDSSIVGLSEESAQQTSGMQPSLGASTSRCDGQSIAASG